MISWPALRAGEALEALARHCGHTNGETPAPPPEVIESGPKALGEWLEAAALRLGMETEAEEIRYIHARDRIRSAPPALIWCSEVRLLALLGPDTVIAPDLSVKRVGCEAIRAELCLETEQPMVKEVNRFLEAGGIPRHRWGKARNEILKRRLASVRVGYAWALRTHTGSNFWQQLKEAGIARRLGALVAAYVAQYVLWLLGWWIVGIGTLQGRLDSGLLLAWALLLATLIPLRGAVSWLQGHVAITASGILKERLLAGALRLQPDIRREGAGQLLGRVIESEALESLALSGGFLALVSVLELLIAAVILAAGAGGLWHSGLLALWTAFTLLVMQSYFRRQRKWTGARLWMTHDLVERMVGHRTRLVQELREYWHQAEDYALDGYQELSRSADRKATLLMGLIPRGWLALGISALGPAFVFGSTSGGMALGLGGVLLAYAALKRLTAGLWNLVEARIAWKQVAPLFRAAALMEIPGASVLSTVPAQGTVLIEAHDLTFRYSERGEPVLRRCNLNIDAGDRILLEGPSGGGKSTLASVLCGTLRPESGLLLAGGLDRQSLGASGWRRRITAAPQFHENHVLTGTFAFNLLMGRRGWIEASDLEEAEAVCRELGLGPLLEKMPAGMLQMVGESGWQLSHGEMSRLYIARALLQRTDVLVFDESFAALDPENLSKAMDCVLRRARTVLVIAHP